MQTVIPAALLALFPSLLPAATLVGSTVLISREVPSMDFFTGPFSTTVVSGSTDVVSVSTGNNTFVNPEADRILFIFGPWGGSGGDVADNRIIVDNLYWFGEPGLILGAVSATSNLEGFSPDFVTFTDHSVSLALGSFRWWGEQSVEVRLTPVPEPEAPVLLSLGIFGVFQRRRRQ